MATMRRAGGWAKADFQAIVNQAAERFQSEYNIDVLPDARNVLIDRGKEHQIEVERELALNKITISDLTTFVYRQLEETLQISSVAPFESVDARLVMLSMAHKCHYFPWC